MAKTKLREYKRLSTPVFTMPNALQDVIPVNRISEKGIFELEAGQGVKLYDRMYMFEDANYFTEDEEQREKTIKNFKKMINSLNVDFKIIISNEPMSLEELNESILESALDEKNEPLARAYAEYIREKTITSRKGIQQVRYFIISCLQYDFDSAQAYFATVEGNLARSFKRMGSGLIPLNAGQRLRTLHTFFRMKNEKKFSFSWEDSLRMRRDWRRDIINTTIREHDTYLTLDYGKKYASVLFIQKYPSGLEDTFVRELMDMPFQVIYTEDCEPVDKDFASEMLQKKYSSVQKSIDTQQQMKNKNGNFSTEVSYVRRREIEELEDGLDGLRSFDEKMFYVDILICVTGNSKKELELNIERIMTAANSHTIKVVEHQYRQMDALKTVLPTAARFVNTMRPMFTTSLSGFVPFNTEEINDPRGFFYGVNQVSKNEIRINRKKLKNGNGFYFGVSGGGKSQTAKMEMGQVVAYTEDDLIAVDPMGEYEEAIKKWNGQYVKFSENENNHYINPLHIPDEKVNEKNFITEKSEFMHAICEQAIKPDILSNKHINIIDRATKAVFQRFFKLRKEGKTTDSPTLIDIREEFIKYSEEDNNEYAKDLAEEMEMFVSGTLNIFTHQDTMDSHSRVTGYSIDSLGKKMKSVAMLIIIEKIRTKIKYNSNNKIATWAYFDEVHEFWKDEYAMVELDSTWREVRKLGGLATGMTQMILDGLQNPETKAMISNSEFAIMVEQGSIDKENLFDVFNISNEQLSYVNGVEPGTGIIRAGRKIIPFDNIVPKDNELYKLYNTSFHDEEA